MQYKKLTGVVVLMAVLCGCEESTVTPEPEVEEDEGESALYLAATRIWDDTTTTSYFHLFSSLNEGTEIDVKQALEVPGAAKLYAYGELGWFAIGGGDAPTITRYSLDERGKLKEGDSISLQPYGVQDLWDSLYFVSKDKAYYPDTSGSQLIVWNPSKMEVTGVVELPKTVREGFLSYYGLTPLLRGNHLIFSVGWFDWLTNDTVLGETGLVVLDTETDSVVDYTVDERCGGITQLIETKSGDAYFVSSALAAATYELGRLETEPCALRIKDGEERFDAKYVRKLATLTGGALAGEPAPGGGNEILLRVLDDELAKVESDAQTWELTGQEAWRWSRWNVESDELTPVDALPPSTADVFWFRLENKVFASETKSDYSQTTLLQLDADGAERKLTLPGFLQGIARIR